MDFPVNSFTGTVSAASCPGWLDYCDVPHKPASTFWKCFPPLPILPICPGFVVRAWHWNKSGPLMMDSRPPSQRRIAPLKTASIFPQASCEMKIGDQQGEILSGEKDSVRDYFSRDSQNTDWSAAAKGPWWTARPRFFSRFHPVWSCVHKYPGYFCGSQAIPQHPN